MRPAPLPLVGLLAGCGFGLQPTTAEGIAMMLSDSADGGFSDVDTDTDADVDDDLQPEIDSIEPNRGTTAGGTEVVLSGTFGDDATVRVGGVEADNKSVQEKRGILVFFTPEMGDEGPVSVVLESSGETATAEDKFTYYTDGTGLVGAVGRVTWVDIVGDYWVDPPVDTGFASAIVIKPAAFDWTKFYAASQDECESTKGGYAYNPLLESEDPGAGSSVTLTSGSAEIRMPWDTTYGQFADNDLSAAEFAPNSTYDISEVSFNNDEMPEFTVTAAVQTPGSFTVTTPNLHGDTVLRISQNFSLAWSGGGATDGVLLSLQLMNAAGTAVDEEVSCSLRDDGSFNLPTGSFQNWIAGRQLNIFVSRFYVAGGTIDFNNADTAIIGEYMVYGAVFTK